MFFDFIFPKRKNSYSRWSYNSNKSKNINIKINYIYNNTTQTLPEINSNQSQNFKNEMIFMVYNFNVYNKIDTLIDELIN